MSLSHTRLLLFFHCFVCIDGKWKQFNDCIWLCRYEYWLLITFHGLRAMSFNWSQSKCPKWNEWKTENENKKIEKKNSFDETINEISTKMLRTVHWCDENRNDTKYEVVIKYGNILKPSRIFFFYRLKFCYHISNTKRSHGKLFWKRTSCYWKWKAWHEAREESRMNLLRLSPFCIETIFLSHISISLYSDNCTFWYLDVFYTITVPEVFIRLYTYIAF